MILTQITRSVLADLETFSKNSRDPSTKCGAVIYEGDRIVSAGWNDPRIEVEKMAKKARVDVVKLIKDRNFKINITEHAECAAIRHAKENGYKIYHSSKMLITSTPCLNCAINIVKANICHVGIVGHMPDFNNENWGTLWRYALLYLSQNDVEVLYYDKEGRLVARVEDGAIVPFGDNKS